ncbi:DNA-binding NtrC family response regulator [Sphingomonas sp. BE138]|uniref:sigma-54-dependent transcriptional regulator n=1 Tax=Sphingomonas sp. BE138 TaxID=2817845 RepID=UPI002861E5D9|nr:response regulator [Sphingomonas sp. BE138]MDR6787719.1 DNA-binding NtrC family response regulator [Sphingomonas sp. BE138]
MNTRFSPDSSDGDRSSADTLSTDGQSSALSILLIDDNPAVARALEIAFRIAGHAFDTAASPAEGYSRLAERRFDAILLDMNFSPGQSSGDEGLACLARVIADDPAACIVALTAHSGIRIAVAAMQAGARDFVMKPWRNAELIAKVEAAVARPPAMLAAALPSTTPVRLLGESAAIQRLRAQIQRFGPSGAGIAVTGPSGSGRTLAALALHAASADPEAPIRVDLRDADAWMRLDTAPGTAILRHADLLDAVAQARLLDRLPVATRCIAIVDDGAPLSPALRRRLATVEIAVPPLADRDGDAVLLARHFARLAAERFGRPGVSLTPAAEATIAATRWSDEVRGLALAVERAVLLADGAAIDAAALALPEAAPAIVADTFDLDDAERVMIQAALRRHRHNVTHAATALGLSRGALYRRMARYGL